MGKPDHTKPERSSQADKFREAARELGCDESGERFEEALRKIGRKKPAAKPEKEGDK